MTSRVSFATVATEMVGKRNRVFHDTGGCPSRTPFTTGGIGDPGVEILERGACQELPCFKDFVLVWQEDEDPGGTLAQHKADKRSCFEKNLEDDGICLTRSSTLVPLLYDNNQKKGGIIREVIPFWTTLQRVRKLSKMLTKSQSSTEFVACNFVHVHVPHKVLCDYAAIMKLRLPVKERCQIEHKNKDSEDWLRYFRDTINRFCNCIDDHLVKVEKQNAKHKLMVEYSNEKSEMFDVTDPNFFSKSARIMVAHYILERTSYTTNHEVNKNSDTDCGIQRLIEDRTYVAAYPLHDAGDAAEDSSSVRAKLLHDWASVSRWAISQPIDTVSEYLGVKNGIYFAWLGFYTYMLVPAAAVGVACFLYGVVTLSSDTLSRDVCEKGHNITLCPSCDKICDYEKLSDMCGYAQATYIFDNHATIFLAVFMSIWSSVYIDLWKRHSAVIMHRWGMTGFDDLAELPRPEYLAGVAKVEEHKKKKVEDTVTGRSVWHVSFWKVRVPLTVFSFSVVLVLIAVVAIAVFGVLLYEMAMSTTDFFLDYPDGKSYMKVFMHISTSFINLAFILLLNKVYSPLAEWLTDREYLRTQSQYDNSLTLKSYLFEFVNTYSSTFYITFLKGKFPGYPAKYNRVLGLRQEECSGSGCLMDLSIQVMIMIVGEQALRLIWNSVRVAIYKWTEDKKDDTVPVLDKAEDEQWIKDFQLKPWAATAPFKEYLEMVLQYGLVTIFVAAFPLAPLFALINNVFELRLDAKKFLTVYRRSVPQRVKDIGVWLHIMEVLSRIAIITNAFIIAFSSSFIPQLVYKMAVAKGTQEDVGFLEFSLAYFNTSDFEKRAQPMFPSENVTICRYPEYRNPPGHEKKYKRPLVYWHILVARLVFIVVFQNVVSVIGMTTQYLIPNTPLSLREQVRIEAHHINNTIINEVRQKRKTLAAMSHIYVPATVNRDGH